LRDVAKLRVLIVIFAAAPHDEQARFVAPLSRYGRDAVCW
jgi:hypothetical protein